MKLRIKLFALLLTTMSSLSSKAQYFGDDDPYNKIRAVWNTTSVPRGANQDSTWLSIAKWGITPLSKTHSQIATLIGGSTLTPNRWYFISDKNIFVRAMSANTLSTSAVLKATNCDYNNVTGNFIGVWSGTTIITFTPISGGFQTGEIVKDKVTTGQGEAIIRTDQDVAGNRYMEIISSNGTALSTSDTLLGLTSGAKGYITGIKTSNIWSSITTNKLVAWNNIHYKNTTGTATIKHPKYDATNWTALATTDASYQIEYDNIVYDFANDIITKREDKRGNIVVDNSGYPNSITKFQWGRNNTSGNHILSFAFEGWNAIKSQSYIYMNDNACYVGDSAAYSFGYGEDRGTIIMMGTADALITRVLHGNLTMTAGNARFAQIGNFANLNIYSKNADGGNSNYTTCAVILNGTSVLSYCTIDGDNSLVTKVFNSESHSNQQYVRVAYSTFVLNDTITSGTTTLALDASGLYGIYNVATTGGVASITSITNVPVFPVTLQPIGSNALTLVHNGSTLRLKGGINQTVPVSGGWVQMQSLNTVLQEVNSSQYSGSIGGGGGGTTNYVMKWTSSTVAGNSVMFDDGTNIGIGSSSPTYKLDVNGAIRTNSSLSILSGLSPAIQIQDGGQASGKVLTSDGSGNGTWQTNAALSSSWNISGNSGLGSTNFIGTKDAADLRFRVQNHKAGVISYSNDNTFFGWAADTVVTGYDNSGFGTKALGVNTSGHENSSFGSGTLQQSTGNDNTAIGYNALLTNTTGNNNTAVGSGADVGSAALSNATAIGYNAVANTSNSLVLGSGANVGIGTSSPSAKLDVSGTVRIHDGTEGAAKVLTSDASGNATWQTGSGGATGATGATGDLFSYSATNTQGNIAAVASGSYLRSAGTSTQSVWSTEKLPNSSTLGYITHSTATNALGESSNLKFIRDSSLIVNANRLPSSQNSAIQFGAQKMLLGSTSNGLNMPTFIELLQSDGTGNARKQRCSMGYLGFTEMNLSVNMDYTTGSHRYYDSTKVASWMYLGNTTVNLFGLQWTPANNSNQNDIWTNNGSTIPFKVNVDAMPTSGSGIMGFSKTYTKILDLVDETNTTSTTHTPFDLDLNAGVLEFNGMTGYKFDATLKTVAGSNVIASTNYMTTSGSGAQFILGIDERLQAGYTGSGQTVVRNYYNSVAGTAGNLKLGSSFTNAAGNFCEQGVSYATTSGYNVGAWFEALGGNESIGLIGKSITAKNSASNVGVIGVGDNTGSSPIYCGGYFGIGQSDNPTFANAALLADNGTKSAPIFVARDNGTEKFRIADGGNVGMGSASPAATLDVNGSFKLLLGSDATGDIYYNSGSGTHARLGIGSTGQHLVVSGGLPSWASQAGVANYTHNISAPTTGGTVSLTNNQYNIINPAGALLALTINLPSTPANNDVVYIKFTQNITTVTYANGTVVDGITAPTAGGLIVLNYDIGTASWY